MSSSDEPRRTRRQILRSLATGVTGIVVFEVISAVTNGIVNAIAHGLAIMCGTLTLNAAGELYRLRHPSKGAAQAEGRVRIYASAFMAVFFVASGAFVFWMMESPSGGCVDCDTTGGRMFAYGLLVVTWGFAGFLAWQAFRLHRRQRAQG